MISLDNKHAVVTGASSGIGRDICLELAKQNCHLTIVARREDRLQALKDDIKKAAGVDVNIVPLDLAQAGSPEALRKKVRQSGRKTDILINNAGLGIHNYFLNTPWEQESAMLALLITNLVHTTKLFVQDMVSQGFGRILNTSSIGAFQPTPTYATYAAAKSFVLNFSLALNHELRGTGVRCSVLCPGVTRTEFQKVAVHNQDTLFMKLTAMSSQRVARSAVKGLRRGKPLIIPGLVNAFSARMQALMPSALSASIAGFAMGKPE